MRKITSEILQQTNAGLGYPFKGGNDTWEIFTNALNQRLATSPEEIIEIDENGKVHGDISGLCKSP